MFMRDLRVAMKAEEAVQLPGKLRMQWDLEINNRKVTSLDLIDGDKGPRAGRAEVELCRTKDSHLLLKVDRKATSADLKQEVTSEALFSNSKDTDGGNGPRNILLNLDGKKYLEAEASEIRFVDPL